MPRIKQIFCSGICFLFVTALNAQVAAKNKSLSTVVAYQLYQQKQWNYHQLPKNSIQYKSDPKYITHTDKRTTTPLLHLNTVPTPLINKKFTSSPSYLENFSSSFLQKSRFLSYHWGKQNLWPVNDHCW
jgi:hypothetical protein